MTWPLGTGARALRNWWIDHPSSDWIWAALVVAGEVATGAGLSAQAPSGPRHVWYQTLAGVLAGLLGIAVTAATILWALARGPRLQRLVRGAGTRITRLYLTSIVTLAAAAFLVAVAIPLDSGSEANRMASIVDAILILAVLRGCRLLWMLVRMFVAISEDVRESTEPSSWQKPHIADGDYVLRPRR